MIRRTFLRRMAHAAMAGMLGAELAWRAPRPEGLLTVTSGASLDGIVQPARYYATIAIDNHVAEIAKGDKRSFEAWLQDRPAWKNRF